VSQPLDQGSGINPAQSRNPAFFQQAVQGFSGRVMGREASVFGDDIASYPGAVGLKIIRVDTVVADQRVGLNQNLAVVGGVGDGFHITHHPRVKNDFPPGFSAGSESSALKDRSIFEDQHSVFRVSVLLKFF
jgi:hypothetical protein